MAFRNRKCDVSGTIATVGTTRSIGSHYGWRFSTTIINRSKAIYHSTEARRWSCQARIRYVLPLEGNLLARDPSVAQVQATSKKRKERDPNWVREEILALVEAKREEYIEELDIVDARDLIVTDVSKWTRIATKVSNTTGGDVTREGPACKHKWQSIMSDYKRIADFHGATGRNEEEYFQLRFADRKQLNLPRSFFSEVYQSMHELMVHRPIMNPPHARDLLHPGDGNFHHDRTKDAPDNDIFGSDEFTEFSVRSGGGDSMTVRTLAPMVMMNIDLNGIVPLEEDGPMQPTSTSRLQGMLSN